MKAFLPFSEDGPRPQNSSETVFQNFGTKVSSHFFFFFC